MDEIADLIQEATRGTPTGADCDDLAALMTDELCRRTNSSGSVGVDREGDRRVASISLDEDTCEMVAHLDAKEGSGD